MIEFDQTEFTDDGLTAASLMAISSLLGEEVAILLYGVVVPIDLDRLHLRSDLFHNKVS